MILEKFILILLMFLSTDAAAYSGSYCCDLLTVGERCDIAEMNFVGNYTAIACDNLVEFSFLQKPTLEVVSYSNNNTISVDTCESTLMSEAECMVYCNTIPCNGDFAYCQNRECDLTSSCYCQTSNYLTNVMHQFSNGRECKEFEQVETACYVRRPELNIVKKQQQQQQSPSTTSRPCSINREETTNNLRVYCANNNKKAFMAESEKMRYAGDFTSADYTIDLTPVCLPGSYVIVNIYSDIHSVWDGYCLPQESNEGVGNTEWYNPYDILYWSHMTNGQRFLCIARMILISAIGYLLYKVFLFLIRVLLYTCKCFAPLLFCMPRYMKSLPNTRFGNDVSKVTTTTYNNITNYFKPLDMDSRTDNNEIHEAVVDLEPVVNKPRRLSAERRNMLGSKLNINAQPKVDFSKYGRPGKTSINTYNIALLCLISISCVTAQSKTIPLVGGQYVVCSMNQGTDKCNTRMSLTDTIYLGDWYRYQLDDKNVSMFVDVKFVDYSMNYTSNFLYFTCVSDRFISQVDRRCGTKAGGYNEECASVQASDATGLGRFTNVVALNTPGFTLAFGVCGCAGCDCPLCSEACLLARLSILCKSDEIFQVSQPSVGLEVPKLEITYQVKGKPKVGPFYLLQMGSTQKAGVITARLNGLFDNPGSSLQQNKLISRWSENGWTGQSFFAPANPLNQLIPGAIGETQTGYYTNMRNPQSNSYNVAQGMATVTHTTGSVSAIANSDVLKINTPASAALPNTKTSTGSPLNGIMSTPDGMSLIYRPTITAGLNFIIEIPPQEVTLYYASVCPLVDPNYKPKVSGCYSCANGATLMFRAMSTCSVGSADMTIYSPEGAILSSTKISLTAEYTLYNVTLFSSTPTLTRNTVTITGNSEDSNQNNLKSTVGPFDAYLILDVRVIDYNVTTNTTKAPPGGGGFDIGGLDLGFGLSGLGNIGLIVGIVIAGLAAVGGTALVYKKVIMRKVYDRTH